MTILNLIYCVLGAVFIVLGAACLWEKYRTVRGGMRLPARILECRRQGSAARKRSGGYCYMVEFTSPDGIRHTAATNDSFWFERPNRVARSSRSGITPLPPRWWNAAVPKPRSWARCLWPWASGSSSAWGCTDPAGADHTKTKQQMVVTPGGMWYTGPIKYKEIQHTWNR